MEYTDILQSLIVCPNCESKHRYIYQLSISQHTPIHVLTCQTCKCEFKSYIVKVRSKRSKKTKERREFTVRVILFSGEEDLITFCKFSDLDDFELRARDIVAFSYLNDRLRIVQNLTLVAYHPLKLSPDASPQLHDFHKFASLSENPQER